MTRPHHEAAPQGRWCAVDQAATFLDVSVVQLRRLFERNARKEPDGTILSRVDGLTARKLGRQWRVWLSPSWLAPSAPQK
jgi:transposase InsO family protein